MNKERLLPVSYTHLVKESNIEELMGTDPRPYTAASYDNNNWPNCIDPDVFYDEDGLSLIHILQLL